MCSSFCRLLIFKWLKIQVHPEVNSLKWFSGACSNDARPLLLRRNREMRDNATPSEGVQVDLRQKWLWERLLETQGVFCGQSFGIKSPA